MKTHTENLLEFIKDNKGKTPGSTGEINLLSYVCRVENINFDSILYVSQNKTENFFYWNIPVINCTAFCLDSIFSVSENGIDRAEKTENKISAIQKISEIIGMILIFLPFR